VPDNERVEQLQRLAVRLMQTERQERRRIGELLREDVMQILEGIGMLLRSARMADHDKRPAVVPRTMTLLSSAIEKLRELAAELRPEALSEMGAEGGILWLTAHMRETHGLNVHVHAGEGIEPISEELRFFLYDGARKLLANVAAHSGCKEASLELFRVDPGHVRLKIEDKGKGFDAAQLQDIPDGSFGLFSLREQAELLGGELEVRSTPGRGTETSLTVPG
jgi:two-component system sensor histidine kinase NreB